ncbi:molybdenum cofactor sulfurase [Rhizobium wenxiniae]|uniref:MOSC domain-containing protein n=1 Tax=Rhizobium wenxiniae TaxID=1737357 RepID=A0A7X0D482_9HYPH|nr:MOSC N-terminal beta barrel domain-containing protein [Rhizobium wenxiniae]MBB6166241.1 hypothetical protein [Rhizobium wenxiniae]GGG22223.1 molybdenum cofactor sulfurase [Rhizobium wenxiniae]
MGETVGTIEEIWRYPVCSIGGERLDKASVTVNGIHGDRTHLLVDLDTGEVASPEKTPRWRPALILSSWHNGSEVLVSSSTWEKMAIGPDLDAALSDFMGFRCGIRPIGAAPGTDISRTSSLKPRYEIAPLHLLTVKSVSDLASLLPESVIDRQRFRPNLVLATGSSEDGWLARNWASGTVGGTITEKTKRCGMTMVAQPDLPEDPDILRTIVRQRARCIGVYSGVTDEGTLSVGDTFSLL